MTIQAQLTRFKPGSFQEITAISLPLMLSALSGAVMIFVDRLILANFSTHAMNAVVSASMFAMIFHMGSIGIASIAEVFVGQHNGAGNTPKTSEPVWQMLWFSLFTALLFVPLGLFAGKLIIAPHYYAAGNPYFVCIMLFGPFFSASAALTGFYVGRGKVKLVTTLAIIGNLVNILLDYVFVFGVKGVIPSMGTLGAGLATVVAQLLQFFVMAAVFLNTYHRKHCGSNQCRFNFKVFWSCLKIGTPNAIGHMIEITAWALQLYLLAMVSAIHLTVATIGQSIFSLFAFATEGLQKGMIATASNAIGGKNWQRVSQSFKAAIKLLICLSVLVSVPLLFYNEPLIEGFLANESLLADTQVLMIYAKIMLFWLWLYFLIDGLVWIVAGILTAGGDTKFTMVVNAFNAWAFALTPIYIFVVQKGGTPILPWKIMVLYASINVMCFMWRYKTKKWQRQVV